MSELFHTSHIVHSCSLSSIF